MSRDAPLLERYLEGRDRSATTTVGFVCERNRRVKRDIAYRVRDAPGVQPATETLGLRSGCCRDSGWLLGQLLRHVGIAPRCDPAIGSSLGAMHAWAEIYIPGAGWIGLDPTSGLLAGEGHIPPAATPSPAGAAPISERMGPPRSR